MLFRTALLLTALVAANADKVQVSFTVIFNQTVSNSIEVAVGMCAPEGFAAAMSADPTVCDKTAYDTCTSTKKYKAADVFVGTGGGDSDPMCTYVGNAGEPSQSASFTLSVQDVKTFTGGAGTFTGPTFTAQTLFDYAKKDYSIEAWKSQFKLCMGRVHVSTATAGVETVTTPRVDKVKDTHQKRGCTTRSCTTQNGVVSCTTQQKLGTNDAGNERQLRITAVLAAAAAAMTALTFSR